MKTKPSKKPFLWLRGPKKLKDFEVEFSVRLPVPMRPGENHRAGILVRGTLESKKGKEYLTGAEIQLGLKSARWGSILLRDKEGLGLSGDLEAPPEVLRLTSDVDFTRVWIRCLGQRISVRINGFLTIDQDFKDLPNVHKEGFLAFGGEPGNVEFRDLRIRDLPLNPKAASMDFPVLPANPEVGKLTRKL